LADLTLIDCRGCGEPVLARTSACWRCATPLVRSLSTPRRGLGDLSAGIVVVAIFAVALLGAALFATRAAAIASHDAAAAAARDPAGASPPARVSGLAPPTSASPQPAAPDGMHLVQAGESLFSVANRYGLSPAQLVYWNSDEYPRLRATPALDEGWILRVTGPPLPRPTPRPTPGPTRAPPPTQPMQPTGTPYPVAGLPAVDQYGPAAFPAADHVTVSYYTVSGSTPHEISASKRANGPWSDWLQGAAGGMVRPTISYNFVYRNWSDGTCDVVLTGAEPISRSYTVILPSWTPPPGTASSTVAWWNQSLAETVAHEGHHIEIHESLLPGMAQAIASGDCGTVSSTLSAIQDQARSLNCDFDMAEYGAASGLSLEACLNG
jgi:predicted secreted Zn-dependent protease/LysM repeat protein